MRRRRDGGSIHVLEAVTAAVLMMSTLAFVLTFDMAPSRSSVTQEILMQRVEDVGFILNDTPTDRPGSCDGNTEEEKYLIDGLGGDSTRWRTRVNDSFGQDRIVGMVLENGKGTYEVHEGPANAAKGWFSKPFRPEWSYLDDAEFRVLAREDLADLLGRDGARL